MTKKPTYEELEKMVKELKKEAEKRKQVQDELRESYNKLQTTFDAVQDNMNVVDLNFNLTDVNAPLIKRFGLPDKESLLGRKCFEVLKGRKDICPSCAVAETYRTKAPAYRTSTPEDEVSTGGRSFEIFAYPIMDHRGNISGAVEFARDITERKQVEETLRIERDNLRNIFESIEDGIYIVNQEYDIQYVNQVLIKDFGPYEGVKCYRYFHDRDEVCPWCKNQDVWAGKTVRWEWYSFKNEKIYDLIDTPLTLPDDSIGKLEIFRDITDMKQAKEALKESEERYRTLSEQSADAIYTTTQEGKFSYINQSFLDLFGYTKEELEDLKAQDTYVNSEDRSRFQQEIEKTSSVRDFEVKLRKKDGTEIDCLITSNVRQAYDGSILGYQGIIRDITEHKSTEESLKESEEKYRTILESIEDGYYEVDIAGSFTFFNDSICKILGYTNDELMGMNNRQYTEKENAKKLYQTFNRVYKTGKPTKIFDWEIIRKDGTKGHVETSVSIMKDSEGNPTGFRGIVRDITEKKNLEAQLLQAQKMEAIGTLAGGIAHNFNNLLMGIQGNTSLMLLDINSNHPHYERLTNIEKLVQSGSKLTSQLLGYARGGRYEVRPISMDQLIKDTSATFSMTKKDITIHQELDKDLSGVKADQSQIEQALLNIYVNAAEAMPGGGELFLKTINVTDKDIKGKPYKVRPGDYILLTIRDTGIGMDKNTKEKIFDPFFTTKGLAKGTGLGLASVYGIIKAHGGYIDVESKKGHGATFYIYLPATKAEGIAQRADSESRIEILQGKETVLLVDDEEMILDVGEDLLKTLGYKVLIAEGGKEAIDIISRAHRAKSMEPEEKGRYAPSAMRFAIDLVILDMIMPGMGGGETYDRLKEINPDIKVLLSSGYSINGQAKEILERGCNGFIQKPFTMKELSKAIREVLEKR